MVKSSKGFRSRTRGTLTKEVRERGMPPITRFLQTFELGSSVIVRLEASDRHERDPVADDEGGAQLRQDLEELELGFSEAEGDRFLIETALGRPALGQVVEYVRVGFRGPSPRSFVLGYDLEEPGQLGLLE